MNILIVDDSEIIRTTLPRLIAPYLEGAEFYFATNVWEAISQLNKLPFSDVILDIHMPGGSGFDVLKVAKSHKPAPRVIILTNYASDAYRKKAAKEGADYFFDKSTDYEELVKVISGETKNSEGIQP
jgi:DNA-binding response OmpR family regulator